MTVRSWDLQDRSVVITGASSGMGAEAARFLGAQGANVTLQGRDRHRLEGVAAEISAAGGGAHVVVLELEELEGVHGLVAQAVESFGRIDGLVLNASLFDPRPIRETTLESLQRQWNTNVVSHYLIAQAALPSMPPGSSIVFVSSTTGLAGFPGCSAYSATKGATEALSRALAIELAPVGIRVNSVAPGFVRTPMLTPVLDASPGYEDYLKEQTPLGRIGEPEEIGATIAFLLSGLAPYVNGACIVADGGWTTR
jgi:NAD(P)-dependent dehydrogenase (short-subunit alcohol dehydrogenase family)